MRPGSCTATSSRRTSCSPTATACLRARARLRARADGRRRDADRAGRRARNARVHLARAARGRRGDAGGRRLGRRRDAVGGACGTASVLARLDARDGARDRGRRAAARRVPAGPAEALLLRSSTARSRRIPARRPSARELADALRGRAPTTSRAAAGDSSSADADRARPGGSRRLSAALLAGWTSAALPFFPPGWPLAARRSSPSRRRSSASAPESRSLSPCRSSRSATSRSGWRCSTRRSPQAGSLVTWREPRVDARSSSSARCSRRSPRSASCRSLSHASARRPLRMLDRRARRAHGRARRRNPARRRCRSSAAPRRSGWASPARADRSTSPARSPARPPRTPPSCSRPARSPLVALALPHVARTRPLERRARRGDDRAHRRRRPERRRAPAAPRRLGDRGGHGASRACLGGTLSGGVMVLRAIEQRTGASLRGRLRPRLPDERPAGRARAQAREGDGRAPLDLGHADLRPERVHDLPLDRRPRAVRGLRELARLGARGVPLRARHARELRAADAAARPLRDGRRPRRRRVRHRDAHGAVRTAAATRTAACRGSGRPARR